MPPLVPGQWISSPFLAREGVWLPGAGELQVYAFAVNPYGFPGLRFLGAGIRRGAWALAFRQYGNELYRHFRVNLAVPVPNLGVLGLGVESLRFGTMPAGGFWLEAGTEVFRGADAELQASGWLHALEHGYRWVGTRLVGVWRGDPEVRVSLDLEPGQPVVLAVDLQPSVHRLVTLRIGYRSFPRLVALSLGLRSQPSVVYGVAYHPELQLSHGIAVVWGI